MPSESFHELTTLAFLTPMQPCPCTLCAGWHLRECRCSCPSLQHFQGQCSRLRSLCSQCKNGCQWHQLGALQQHLSDRDGLLQHRCDDLLPDHKRLLVCRTGRVDVAHTLLFAACHIHRLPFQVQPGHLRHLVYANGCRLHCPLHHRSLLPARLRCANAMPP